MTTKNYTQMTNQELVDEVNSLNYFIGRITRNLQRDFPNLLLEILNRTKFLESDGIITIPILERLYCLEHDLTSIPLCKNPNCTRQVSWSKQSFNQYCCPKCRASDQDFKEHLKQIFIQKYGVDQILKSKQIREKIRETNLKLYGVEHAMQNEDVLNKLKTTCIQRYGEDNIFKTDEFKTICMEKLGVSNPQQSQVVKDKIKHTCLKRYGVECSLQSKEVHEKAIETNIEKYGVEYSSQNEDVKSKTRNTCMDKYGVDSPLKSKIVMDKLKQTNMDRYGVEYSFQSNEIRNKGIETCMKKYGVDNYSKTHEFHKLRGKKYTNPKYPNMSFDSSWEFRVYDFCIEHNLDFEYQPAISIPYEYDGTSHTYHPDFLINGQLFEVKGDQFFRLNESGVEEMFLPYRNPEWSDEEYIWHCGEFEAKHQCMLANGVIILRNDQIERLSIDLFSSL